MITIIEQPDFWESAYRPVLVKFKNLIVGGGSTLFVQNSIAQPTKRFVGFEPFSRFAKLGDNIEFIETGGSLQVGKVVGFETVGGDYGCIVNLPSISGSSSYTLTYVAIRQQARVDLILKTGSVYSELNKTIALASTPAIDGIHSVDLGGFLQNSFNPITAICDGVDQPMFTHYELYQKINSTDSALLFPYKVAVNSVVPNYLDSYYYFTKIANSKIIKHNASEYLWSRILDDQILLSYAGVPPGPATSYGQLRLFNSVPTLLSTNNVEVGTVVDLTAPSGNLQVFGSAFGVIPSNTTRNISVKNQDGNDMSVSSLSGNNINITEPRVTTIRFTFAAGEDTSDLLTIVTALNAGSYTATTNDGASGTITFSKNAGSYAAFSNPLALANGDTIQIKRSTFSAAGWVQITGTY